MENTLRRVGIVGYGHLGQYLAEEINTKGYELGLELAFVWNRTKTEKLISTIHDALILKELKDFPQYKTDIIVEVSHPTIVQQFGEKFLEHSDFMICSPSSLADAELENSLRNASKKFGVFIPSGALWGSSDIRKMAERGTLKGLKLTMRFHPKSLKLNGDAKLLNDNVTDKAVVIYEGPVRHVCSIAPNNVNTMAAAAIAGYNLGFDGTIGCLISDPNAKDYHKIEIEVTGPKADNSMFKVNTTRLSSAVTGHVTSSATLTSFMNSLINAKHNGRGFHLC